MTGTVLPLWLEAIVALLVVLGASLALLGSLGLLTLKSFFERVHAPAIIATLGCWCVVLGTVLFFSFQSHQMAAHGILIAVFLALTVPVVTIFLMRTGLFRARLAGQDVPPPLSHGGEGGAAKALRTGDQLDLAASSEDDAALNAAEGS